MASELVKWIERRPQAINVLRNIGPSTEILHVKEDVQARKPVEGCKPTILSDVILPELQAERDSSQQK